MKVLVIRFSSIGDIVLTTPVLRCIKNQLKDVELHYLTKKQYASILDTNPYIDKIKLLDSSWDLMMHELQIEQYDFIIDLHHNLRTLRIKRALPDVKHSSFIKLNISKWFYTFLKINRLPAIHIVDRYLAAAKPLGIINDGKGLDYFINQNDLIKDKDIPASHQYGYIGIVIGAALGTKQLPVGKIKALCESIQYPIMLLGGKEDKANGDVIAASDDVKIYNSCGRFSLNESAQLVQRAKLIITHDTGLMHIAAAFNKPVISIWGNTTPLFGMYPYYNAESTVENKVFEVDKLRCRPCSKIGYKKCPKGHFKCMNNQPIGKIAKTALELIQGNNQGGNRNIEGTKATRYEVAK